MIGSYPRTQAIRDSRRARAEEVQARSLQDPQAQLNKLDKLGLVAAKERAKLARKILKLEEEKQAQAKKAAKKEKK